MTLQSLVIKNKNAKWIIAIFLFFFIYCCWYVLTGQAAQLTSRDRYSPYILLPCCLIIMMHEMGELQTKIFTPESIAIKGLIRIRTFPWNQVVHVATCTQSWVRDSDQRSDHTRKGRPFYQKRVVITFRGGYPWWPNEWLPLWKIKNLNTGISVPYSKQLEDMIRQHYGPLDYETFY